LRMRRVLTSSITAVGYGESEPIADNGTEEGREANRRIEFKVMVSEEVAEGHTPLVTGAETSEEQAGTVRGAGDAGEEEPAAVKAAQADAAAHSDTQKDLADEQN